MTDSKNNRAALRRKAREEAQKKFRTRYTKDHCPKLSRQERKFFAGLASKRGIRILSRREWA